MSWTILPYSGPHLGYLAFQNFDSERRLFQKHVVITKSDIDIFITEKKLLQVVNYMWHITNMSHSFMFHHIPFTGNCHTRIKGFQRKMVNVKSSSKQIFIELLFRWQEIPKYLCESSLIIHM